MSWSTPTWGSPASREHLELYATSGLPQGLLPPAEAAALALKERVARTMAAGYRVFRVGSDILPNPGGPAGTVRFEKAVYVLHAFQKKSPSGIRTAKRDVDLVTERLKMLPSVRPSCAWRMR